METGLANGLPFPSVANLASPMAAMARLRARPLGISSSKTWSTRHRPPGRSNTRILSALRAFGFILPIAVARKELSRVSDEAPDFRAAQEMACCIPRPRRERHFKPCARLRIDARPSRPGNSRATVDRRRTNKSPGTRSPNEALPKFAIVALAFRSRSNSTCMTLVPYAPAATSISTLSRLLCGAESSRRMANFRRRPPPRRARQATNSAPVFALLRSRGQRSRTAARPKSTALASEASVRAAERMEDDLIDVRPHHPASGARASRPIGRNNCCTCRGCDAREIQASTDEPCSTLQCVRKNVHELCVLISPRSPRRNFCECRLSEPFSWC